MSRLWLAAAALCALTGCSTLGGFAGAVAGFATGAATSDPAIGVAVGVTVRAAVDAAGKRAARLRSRAEHDAIASLAGDMNPGDTRLWEVRHRVPPRYGRGEVRVVRVIDTPLAQCKELLFSVVQHDALRAQRSWYSTTACRQGSGWKWAVAEPAVDRWRNLQ